MLHLSGSLAFQRPSQSAPQGNDALDKETDQKLTEGNDL
jgi:hypothetical protein